MSVRLKNATRVSQLLLTLSLIGAAFPGVAAPADGSLEHVVRQGDTLYDLAQAYLQDPLLWPALQRANAVPDPKHLRPGSIVVIPADLLRRTGGATVLYVSGTATLTRGKEAQPLVAGLRLQDGDVVRTEHNGFATLQLIDGSLVRATGDSEVVMNRLKYMMRRKRADTVLDLDRGRVESTVTPQSPTGSRFRIRTPLMAAGVRGTRFGVSVTDGGAMTTDVLDGEVAIVGRDAAIAPAGRTDDAATLVAAGKGTVVTQNGVADPSQLLPAPDLSSVAGLQERPLIDLAFPAVEGASAYRAYLSKDEMLDFVVDNEIFSTARARFEDVDDGDYVVVVRAIDANGIEGKPSVRAIHLKARPEPPVTLAPRHDSELDTAATTLRWTTTHNVAGYDLQLARDERFEHPIVDRHDAGAGSYDVSGLAAGVYYWRVRSFLQDAGGRIDAGPYGDARKFSVRFAVVAAAPVQQGDNVLFRWDGDPGQRYLLQVAHDENFGAIVEQVQTTERQASLGGLPGGTYYLRIQATDPDGYVHRFTQPQQFNVTSVVRTGDGQPLFSPDGAAVGRY